MLELEMSDKRYMCSPESNRGKPPREVFVLQLQEARGVEDEIAIHCSFYHLPLYLDFIYKGVPLH